MRWYPRDRVLTTSLALAGGGLLACVAAVLDIFIPTASPVTYLAVLAGTGLAVAAVVAAFVWCCDKYEDSRDGSVEIPVKTRRISYGSVRMAPRDVSAGDGGLRLDVRLHPHL